MSEIPSFNELVDEYNAAENFFNWATGEQVELASYRLLAAKKALELRIKQEKENELKKAV